MNKTFLILIFSILILNSSVVNAGDRRSEPLLVSKDKTLPGTKKGKVFSKAKKWLKSYENVKILRFSEERGIIEAQAIMPYVNSVKLENIFLSPDAALRTKGTIKFIIRAICEDDKITIEFTDFIHEAYESRYGKISFGTIVNNDKAPLGKCYENTQWCNAVWDDMRTKLRQECAKYWLEAKEEIK